MRRTVAAVIAAALASTIGAAVSSTASASNATRCRHISVLGIPTTEQCIYLPVDPEDLIR